MTAVGFLLISSVVILEVFNSFFQFSGKPIKLPEFGSKPTWTLCEKFVGLDTPDWFMLMAENALFSEEVELLFMLEVELFIVLVNVMLELELLEVDVFRDRFFKEFEEFLVAWLILSSHSFNSDSLLHET